MMVSAARGVDDQGTTALSMRFVSGFLMRALNAGADLCKLWQLGRAVAGLIDAAEKASHGGAKIEAAHQVCRGACPRLLACDEAWCIP